MNTSYSDIKANFKISLKFSLMITVLTFAIFLLARVTGLYTMTYLRFINYVIFLPVAFLAMDKTFLEYSGHIDYFRGLMIGFLTCFLGQLWFTLFVSIYLYFDVVFFTFLVSQMPEPLMFPHLSIGFVLIAEGSAASAIIAFTLMQFYRRNEPE